MIQPVSGPKFLQFLVAALSLLVAFSCAKNEDEFSMQRRQLRRNNPVNITREDPVNYYYQDPGVRSGGYQQQYVVPVQPQYYQPAPVYIPPSYQVPASRFYSNPYAIPASNVAPRYDIDQYYVAPNRYRNVETQQKLPRDTGIDKN